MTRSSICLAFAACLLAAPCLAGEADDWLDLARRMAAEESASPAAAFQAESAVRRAMRAARLRQGEAASVEAAHDVLARLFPGQRGFLDAELAQARLRLGRRAAGTAAADGRAAAEEALSVAWPRALRDRGPAPPPPPGMRLVEPDRPEATLILPSPRPAEPPRWSNPRAVSL